MSTPDALQRAIALLQSGCGDDEVERRSGADLSEILALRAKLATGDFALAGRFQTPVDGASVGGLRFRATFGSRGDGERPIRSEEITALDAAAARIRAVRLQRRGETLIDVAPLD